MLKIKDYIKNKIITNYKKNKDDTDKILLGKILSKINNLSNKLNIQDYEFKVFSQFGEDGIIDYLVKKTKIKDDEKFFVEIGVGDYSECNTKFLLMNDFWTGSSYRGKQRVCKSHKG